MNNELTIEKIRNMLLAHNDGVYLLQSRDDPAEVIEYLLTKIDRIAYCATTIREAARREMDMGCNHAGVQIAFINSGVILKETEGAIEL